MLNTYQKLTSTNKGRFVLIGIAIIVGYIVASLGIETGNLLYYVLFFAIAVYSISLLTKIFSSLLTSKNVKGSKNGKKSA